MIFRKHILNQNLLVVLILHVVVVKRLVAFVVIVVVMVQIVVLQMFVQNVCIFVVCITGTTPAGNFTLNFMFFFMYASNEATEYFKNKRYNRNMPAASVKIVFACFV